LGIILENKVLQKSKFSDKNLSNLDPPKKISI